MRNSHAPARSLWLRLGLAVAAPLVFFAALEVGLRLGGFGRDTRFFIPDEQPGVYRTNPRFTELFFPASFGLKPVNFRLTKEKPAGAVRVFVLGESAAMGVPEPAFGLAAQLRAQLRAVRPGERIEVFNLGVTAINSHAIVEIARQAVLFEPDLLVIYMGNNEVVGPYGVSSVVTAGTPPRALIRAGLRLRQTRTGQLLQRVVGAVGKPCRACGVGRHGDVRWSYDRSGGSATGENLYPFRRQSGTHPRPRSPRKGAGPCFHGGGECS
jgi:hypothetical protein